MTFLNKFYKDWLKRVKEQDPFETIAGFGFAVTLLVLAGAFPEVLKEYNLWILVIGGILLAIMAERAKKAKKDIKEKNIVIEQQKKLVEEKNKEITDSIKYALRIQNAILPPSQIVKEYLNQSFILFRPKDIVSGDFYWLENKGDHIFFAACDCTGHGVPGALVSMVCHNALNRSVREFDIIQPAKILDKVNELVKTDFEFSDENMRDGMDISLCSYNTKTNKLEWAGARNPLWLIRDGELLETKGDKLSIGDFESSISFNNHIIEVKKNDAIYIFSDGFQDQFGANGGKKVTRKRFSELLLSLQKESMQDQRTKLEEFISAHKQDDPQTDDILVMGVKF